MQVEKKRETKRKKQEVVVFLKSAGPAAETDCRLYIYHIRTYLFSCSSSLPCFFLLDFLYISSFSSSFLVPLFFSDSCLKLLRWILCSICICIRSRSISAVCRDVLFLFSVVSNCHYLASRTLNPRPSVLMLRTVAVGWQLYEIFSESLGCRHRLSVASSFNSDSNFDSYFQEGATRGKKSNKRRQHEDGDREKKKKKTEEKQESNKKTRGMREK